MCDERQGESKNEIPVEYRRGFSTHPSQSHNISSEQEVGDRASDIIFSLKPVQKTAQRTST